MPEDETLIIPWKEYFRTPVGDLLDDTLRDGVVGSWDSVALT